MTRHALLLLAVVLALAPLRGAAAFEARGGGAHGGWPGPTPRPPGPCCPPPRPPGPWPPQNPGWDAGAAAVGAYVGITAAQSGGWNAGPASVGAPTRAAPPAPNEGRDGAWGAGAFAPQDGASQGGGWGPGGWSSDQP